VSTGTPVQRRTGPGHATRFAGDGVLILDKPAGRTSHAIVQQVKRKLGAVKVGHGGTLDPFATGLLVLLINGATKLSPYLANQEKRYLFTLHFGVETDSQDSTGKVVARHRCAPLEEREIREACSIFTGEIQQMVPLYSAVRVGGRRLYQLARRGVEVIPPSRTVTIRTLSLLDYYWPEAAFETTCSMGTYVRSLGAELTRYLGCAGHVRQLRRLNSGSFHVGQAVTLEQFEEILAREELDQVLISSARALKSYPSIRVGYLGARRIRQGGILSRAELVDQDGVDRLSERLYRVLDPDDQLVAMVATSISAGNSPREGQITFKTLRVFSKVKGPG
jgi:tRNA pseudouridine55 synthase